VSLQNVGCSVHACNALSELVPAGSALAGLHLYNNMTGDEGAEHVARLLARCPTMADFKLASSRVGPAGGISIAKALSVGKEGQSPGGQRSGACTCCGDALGVLLPACLSATSCSYIGRSLAVAGSIV